MVVWKYKLAIKHAQEIKLPAEFKILTVQMQDGQPTMWVLVDNTKPLKQQIILCANTGTENDVAFVDGHIGTVQDGDGLVWHYFHTHRTDQ